LVVVVMVVVGVEIVVVGAWGCDASSSAVVVVVLGADRSEDVEVPEVEDGPAPDDVVGTLVIGVPSIVSPTSTGICSGRSSATFPTSTRPLGVLVAIMPS